MSLRVFADREQTVEILEAGIQQAVDHTGHKVVEGQHKSQAAANHDHAQGQPVLRNKL